MEQNQHSSLFEMELDHAAQNRINTASKWAKFVAIVSLVIVGSIILGIVLARQEISEKASEMMKTDNAANSIVLMMLAVFCLVFAVATVFLLKASGLLKQGLQHRDADRLAEGFKLLRNYFMIMSAMTALSILSSIVSLLIS